VVISHSGYRKFLNTALHCVFATIFTERVVNSLSNTVDYFNSFAVFERTIKCANFLVTLGSVVTNMSV